jgi:8-amino-3,8-dideoxy-alpha-D-manno-octulosonate transaminase
MPGFEVFGKEEQEAINKIFELNGGILFAHGFDAMRNGVYRVREFEKAFAGYLGVPHAQAVSSGSTGVKVGLKALGIKPGDEVLTTCFTFVATVEAILEVGARPVLVDINETLNIDPAAIDDAVTDRTKAIIAVHMMGAPCQMDEIMAVAEKHGLLVFEDNAQGCGGSYKGRYLGTIGHAGSFSFDGGKTLTTGEGGMVVTSDESIYLRARAYHDHGHEYSTTVGRGAEAALLTGFNYRMNELQGAIGLVQLGKLDGMNNATRENKRKLKERLKNLKFQFRTLADEQGELGDALIFYLESAQAAQAFAQKMSEKGLGTKNLPDAIRWHFAKHWRHMFEEYDFYRHGYQTQWQASADILERSIALPVMVKMTEDRINEVADKVLEIAEEF